VSERYAFIDGERASYPVVAMCAWAGVSRAGYYEWRARADSAAATRRERLQLLIATIFADSDGTYGYRRVQAQLGRWGEPAGLELVRALMRQLDLRPCQPRPYRVTTTPDAAGAAGTPDLLGRDFTADAPGRKLVGDITYLATGEGWLSLATVIDCCTRAVVGWSMADHLRASLACDALQAAAGVSSLSGAVFHSDRGTQYTSAEFRAALARHRVAPSVGRTGVCWDNALAESFFGALKNELVHRVVFASRAQARREIVRYIEGFYNRRRLHSGLGYRTPLEVHTELVNKPLAA
jgi:putative transposase